MGVEGVRLRTLFIEALKRSNKPDSEAISRSSRSSDDTVKVDAVLGSLLLV